MKIIVLIYKRKRDPQDCGRIRLKISCKTHAKVLIECGVKTTNMKRGEKQCDSGISS